VLDRRLQSREGIDEIKQRIAQDLGCAVLLLHHFNKKVDPDDLTGSIGGGRGFMAAMRSRFAWGQVRRPMPDEFPEARRLYGLILLKSNYGELTDSLIFEGEQVANPYSAGYTLPRLVNHGEHTVPPHWLFPDPTAMRESKVEQARNLIRDLIAEHGELRASDLQERVLKQLGISQRSFETARSRLKKEGWIETEKRADGWWWTLGKAPDLPPEDAEA
jgi:hypothetical protein